jgi:hypothetical protein
MPRSYAGAAPGPGDTGQAASIAIVIARPNVLKTLPMPMN